MTFEVFRAVEAFCGAGGLGEGFNMEGYHVETAIDINEDCCKTYGHNHRYTQVLCEDVRNCFFTRKDYDAILAVIGGSPCDDYTRVNTKRDPDSERALLIYELIRMAKEIKPEFLLLENVYSVPKRIKENFVKQLQQLGYKVVSRVINAYDYGAVQIRKRWFVTASKKKHCFPEPLNTRRKAKEILTGEESEIKPRKKTLESIKHLPAGKWVSLPNQSYKVYFVVDPEQPLPAVVNPTKLRYVRPDRQGYLSFNELIKAFDFHPNYEFLGTSTSIGKQIANCVPVSLATAFAKTFKGVYA